MCVPRFVAPTLLLLHSLCALKERKTKNAFQPKYFIAFMKFYQVFCFNASDKCFIDFLVVPDFTNHSNIFFTVFAVFLMTHFHFFEITYKTCFNF